MQGLFSFDGRINRKTFWCRGIIILILLIADYVGFVVLLTFVTSAELAQMAMMIIAMILLTSVYLIWDGRAWRTPSNAAMTSTKRAGTP